MIVSSIKNTDSVLPYRKLRFDKLNARSVFRK